MYPCIYHSCTGLSPPTVAFSKYVPLLYIQLLGSSVFARHYSRNNYCSLFLRLLRCFSSPGFLPSRDYTSSMCRVPPFGHLWINARLQLPIAFRSLPRPSSSLRAKASTIRPYLLPILNIFRTYFTYALSSPFFPSLVFLLSLFLPSCQRTFYLLRLLFSPLFTPHHTFPFSAFLSSSVPFGTNPFLFLWRIRESNP